MTTQREILEALKDRLDAGGYGRVHLGKHVDPDQEVLPVVTIHHHNDGDQTESSRPVEVRKVKLLVELVYETSASELLLEGVDKLDELEEVVIDIPARDQNDTLGGIARNVEQSKSQVINHEQKSTIGFAQLVVEVTYRKG